MSHQMEEKGHLELLTLRKHHICSSHREREGEGVRVLGGGENEGNGNGNGPGVEDYTGSPWVQLIDDISSIFCPRSHFGRTKTRCPSTKREG